MVKSFAILFGAKEMPAMALLAGRPVMGSA
jgi:hypothetical protein